MIVTRDQLRAARMLLRLNQEELAILSKVGVSTIRRFEGGQEIGELHVEALQRAIEKAGALLVEPGDKRGAGVAIKVLSKLPKATRERLQGIGAPAVETGKRRRGRPRRAPVQGGDPTA